MSFSSERNARARIALCIDDFGLHEGVEAAVLELAERARVNAVGCMVGAPGWNAAARRLGALGRDSIDLGLHLDLTQWPLNPQLRAPLAQWIARGWLRRADRARLAAEIRDQLDAFEQASGQRPAYVDGHQHVHQFPLVRESLLDALGARYSPEALPWLRCTRRPDAPARSSMGASAGWRERVFKPWLIETLGARALEQDARARGHALNRRLLGVHDFRADAAGYRRMLRGWLHAARDGDLLMCHPSLRREGAADDPLLDARHSEYRVLASDGFAALLEEASLELAPISRIRAPGAAG